MKHPNFAFRSVLVSGALLLASPSPVAAQAPPAGVSAPQVNIGNVVFMGDTGGLEADRLVSLFNSHIAQFRACYAAGLAASPGVSGDLQVDVTYARNGHVTALTATGLAAVPNVGQCVARVVRPLHFPRLPNHDTTSVRFLAIIQFVRPAEAAPNG